jgi:hypothetical protein
MLSGNNYIDAKAQRTPVIDPLISLFKSRRFLLALAVTTISTQKPNGRRSSTRSSHCLSLGASCLLWRYWRSIF